MQVPDNTTDLFRDGGESAGDGLARIEQVAARTGMTKRTLRYYEEIGLLDPPSRTEGGYRLYSEADVQRLERIKRMRDLLGFTLAEIKEFVRIEEEREHVRTTYQQLTDPASRLQSLDDAEALSRRQLGIVEEKLAGLLDMRASLNSRLERIAEKRATLRRQLAPSQ